MRASIEYLKCFEVPNSITSDLQLMKLFAFYKFSNASFCMRNICWWIIMIGHLINIWTEELLILYHWRMTYVEQLLAKSMPWSQCKELRLMCSTPLCTQATSYRLTLTKYKLWLTSIFQNSDQIHSAREGLQAYANRYAAAFWVLSDKLDRPEESMWFATHKYSSDVEQHPS